MSSPKILNNKLYLYLTEFFSGMSVMAVELGASRLLAPYFRLRIIFRLSKNGRADQFSSSNVFPYGGRNSAMKSFTSG